MAFNNQTLYMHLIDKLLDIYEKRLVPGKEIKTAINFLFNLYNTPSYFLTDSSDYELYHVVCNQLKEEGIISICWKNKIPGHIIEKLTLNLDKIDVLYEKTGRTPKIEMVNSTLSEIYKYKGEHEILDNFLKDIETRISNKKPIKQYIDLKNIEDTQKLLEGLVAVLNNKEEVYVRNLSILALKDSKALEAYENRISKIIKDFSLNQYIDGENIYEAFNVFKTPREIKLKGNTHIGVREGSIDISSLKSGLGIHSNDLDQVKVMPNKNLKYVITIENLTTFHTFDEPDSLIVYAGGFNSSSTISLIKKIHKSLPNAKFYHWGDIDCGGFRIFKHLKEASGIEFSPIYMNEKVYKEHMHSGLELSENDKITLNKMAKDDSFKEFKSLINLMLLNNKKIEQECITISK